MKALFGISVDNKRYSSDETIYSLNHLINDYEEIWFFIADEIQLYNKATQLDKGKTLKDVIKTFNINNNYFEQREKWLLNLKSKLNKNVSSVPWKILNVSTISDNVFHKIFRNILIAFESLNDFKADVISTAISHRGLSNSNYSRFDTELSIAYILEEIAINIRLRVFEKIEDEYYLGELPLPLMKLYQNKYPIDIYTLAGVDEGNSLFNFFFSTSRNQIPYWSKYLS